MADLQLIVMTAAITTGIGVLGKIIFDWLKNRGSNPIMEKCPDHENCLKRLDECETCVRKVTVEMASFRVLFNERTENIQKELARGTKRFDEQGKVIGDIQQNVSALLVLVKNNQ